MSTATSGREQLTRAGQLIEGSPELTDEEHRILDVNADQLLQSRFAMLAR